MRLGVVILPDLAWPDAARRWRQAEELRFDHAWTYDHLAWRSLRDAAWFGAIPTLTAAAVTTERIRLGPLVASPNFRHPVSFAKELVTLDDISEGRLSVGIGSGGTGWDATMLGPPAWSAAERTDRFEEFVALTDRVLRDPAASYAGRYYTADDARTYPGCVQQPRIPFAVAGVGPRAMRVAATYGDTWVTTGDRRRGGDLLGPTEGVEVIRRQMAALDEVCAAVGRDPTSLGRLVLTGVHLGGGLASVEAFADTSGQYAGAGVTDLVVHWPRAAEPYAADPATFERIFTP